MNKTDNNTIPNIPKEWYAEAKKQTIDTLPQYMTHILNDFPLTYDTIVYAVSACALAAAYAADNSPHGGITGFQASFVMWEFIRQWCFPTNKCGLKIVNYDDMLYPQYRYKFEKRITEDEWHILKKQAEFLLTNKTFVHPDVKQHWENISAGIIPFGYEIEKK
jgi:hypothetical protein